MCCLQETHYNYNNIDNIVKKINPPKRHSNPKCVCTKQQSYNTKEKLIERGNRQTHNYSWRLQHPSLNN